MEPGKEVKTCGRCGNSFDCFSKVGGCWCESIPPLPKVTPGHDCLCPDCLQNEIKKQMAAK